MAVSSSLIVTLFKKYSTSPNFTGTHQLLHGLFTRLLSPIHFTFFSKGFRMEIFVSAIVGDVVSRFISFLIGNYKKQMGVGQNLERLHRVLLRIHTVVEEAERRHITNQQMLLQLKMLIDAMYRGYYVLDTFKYRVLEEEAKDEVTLLNPVKRLRIEVHTAKTTLFGEDGIHELRIVLRRLESTAADLKEFIMLLEGCPRLFRGVYSAHLYVGKCMFGRHVEKERIINFLLRTEPQKNLSALPIIGDHKVGKRTLVEYVCNDERVRNYFSLIVLFEADDFRSKTVLTSPLDGGGIKYRKFIPGRSLVIVEFAEDVDEETWRRFHSSARCLPSGSKILIISRTEEAANLGTVEPVRLKHLPQEQYWYFFKVLAFGSADPDEYPKLVSLGKEIASTLKGSFLGANTLCELLRSNLNVQFWQCVLANMIKLIEEYLFFFGDHPVTLYERSHPNAEIALKIIPICLGCNHSKTGTSFFLRKCERSVGETELPKLTVQELMIPATTLPEEEFEVLLWKSPVPPYHKYVATCARDKLRHIVARRKQLRRRCRCQNP